MRKWKKRVIIVFTIPLGLVALLLTLLYTPFVQDLIARKAADYTSNVTGLNITIQKLRLVFPLNLSVKGVEVTDANRDTLLRMEQFNVSVQLKPLFRKEVIADSLVLRNIRANSGDFMPEMVIKGTIDEFRMVENSIDLVDQAIKLGRLNLSNSDISVLLKDTTITKIDTTASTPFDWKVQVAGIDIKGVSVGIEPANIKLNNIALSIDSIFYNNPDSFNAHFANFYAADQSGFAVTSASGTLSSDSVAISIPSFKITTTNSQAELQAYIPKSALDSISTGKILAKIAIQVGKEDIMLVAGKYLPSDFEKVYPNKPAVLLCGINGNLNSLNIDKLSLEIHDVFSFDLHGEVNSVKDSLLRNGKVIFRAEETNLDFVLKTLPAAYSQQFRIPNNLVINGEASLGGGWYTAEIALKDGVSRTLNTKAKFNPAGMQYKAEVIAKNMEPIRFMPMDSLMFVSAAVKAEGAGVDPFSFATWSKIDVAVDSIAYGEIAVSSVAVKGELLKNIFTVNLAGADKYADLDITLDATIKRDRVSAVIDANVRNLNLKGLNIIKDTLSTSFNFAAQLESDLKKDFSGTLSFKDYNLVTSTEKIEGQQIDLSAATAARKLRKISLETDTTGISLDAGDLHIKFESDDYYTTILDQFTKVADTLSVQLKDLSKINLAGLAPIFPNLKGRVTSKTDNPLGTYLERYNIKFDSLFLTTATSSELGIDVRTGVYGLAKDTLSVDTIRINVSQDTASMFYFAEFVKNRTAEKEPLRVTFNGESKRRSIDANIVFSDNKDALLRIYSNPTPIGYKLFTEIKSVDLGAVSAGFKAYLPPMKGTLNAGFEVVAQKNISSITGDIKVDSFFVEQKRVGDLAFNTSYLPIDSVVHKGQFSFSKDHNEVAKGELFYNTNAQDTLQGSLEIIQFPLGMVNPFIPAKMATMSGALNSKVAINGSFNKPDITGYLRFDTTSVVLEEYGAQFGFDKKAIGIQDNSITFDRYAIQFAGGNPLLVDGKIDLKNLSKPMADIKAFGEDIELVNVKQGAKKTLYGKLEAGANTTIKGALDALTVRGDVHITGNTNLTYILKESPLAARESMGGMVTFVSFAADTVLKKTEPAQIALIGLDMVLALKIDPAVQMNVDLTTDHSNYVKMEGGGDLIFQYTRQGSMLLNGRYTFMDGKIKYALPVIPLKEFNITNGSSIQWSGNVMNPTLNVTAIEHIKSAVALEGQPSRMVKFDVGVKLKQNLENLGMEFVISTPEDPSFEEKLTAMGPEERQKQAVAMLVTGTYMGASQGKGGLNTQDVVNGFIQNKLAGAAESVLKKVDITFGMDSYKDGSEGAQKTDYSFSFAKRFYNDRIRIVIGGRVTTGAEIGANDKGQSFIDNISIEYRLDKSGSGYAKLFYDKNYQSILEGEVIETGIGIVLKKRMQRLGELFKFGKKKIKPRTENEAKK